MYQINPLKRDNKYIVHIFTFYKSSRLFFNPILATAFNSHNNLI